MQARGDLRRRWKSLRCDRRRRGVSFAIAAGGVHALLGENGAGKSTHREVAVRLALPDPAAFHLRRRVRLASPRRSHALGIQTAFQEMTLVRDLTVLDNMLLPYGPGRPARHHPSAAGARGGRRAVRRARPQRHLARRRNRRARTGAAAEDRDRACDLSHAGILLLDEPTSTLSGRDVDWLGEIIARLAAEGVTIVFISHRLQEVRAFSGRHGAAQRPPHRHRPRRRPSDADVFRMIVGRSLDHAFPPRDDAARRIGAEVLAADGSRDRGKIAQRRIPAARRRDPRRRRAAGHGAARPVPGLFGMTEMWQAGSAWTANRSRSIRRPMRCAPTSASASCRKTAKPKRCSSSSTAATTRRCR